MRVSPIPPREWPSEMGEVLAVLRPPDADVGPRTAADRPKGLNVLGTFAHHPTLARAWLGFNRHVLYTSTLTPRQREILVLRVAAVRGSEYEWAQHVHLGRDAGLSDEEITAIRTSPADGAWSTTEAALLRAVDELVADGAVSDATWSELAGALGTQQLLDVVFTVGAYETIAWMMRSIELELDDDLRGD